MEDKKWHEDVPYEDLPDDDRWEEHSDPQLARDEYHKSGEGETEAETKDAEPPKQHKAAPSTRKQWHVAIFKQAPWYNDSKSYKPFSTFPPRPSALRTARTEEKWTPSLPRGTIKHITWENEEEKKNGDDVKCVATISDDDEDEGYGYSKKYDAAKTPQSYDRKRKEVEELSRNVRNTHKHGRTRADYTDLYH